MIENKFAYFDSIADMYADGVSANAENTKVFDSDHQIEGIAGTPKIPYETICFIKKPNVTFTHGRFYGLPYPIELKQLVFKTTVNEMEEVTIDGVKCRKSSKAQRIFLGKGESMRFTVGEKYAAYEYNEDTETNEVNIGPFLAIYSNGIPRIIQRTILPPDMFATKFSVRYKNECWKNSVPEIYCCIDEKGYNGDFTGYVYAYRTMKIGLPKTSSKENEIKVAVHRCIPSNPVVGTKYFFCESVKIQKPDTGEVVFLDSLVDVGWDTSYSVFTITQNLVKYSLDRSYPTIIPEQISISNFRQLDRNGTDNYVPISPFFRIVYNNYEGGRWNVICIKPLGVTADPSLEKKCNCQKLTIPEKELKCMGVQFYKTTKHKDAIQRTRGSWKSVYHNNDYATTLQRIKAHSLKSKVDHACRFRFFAKARGKYKSSCFVYAKRIVGTQKAIDDIIIPM